MTGHHRTYVHVHCIVMIVHVANAHVTSFSAARFVFIFAILQRYFEGVNLVEICWGFYKNYTIFKFETKSFLVGIFVIDFIDCFTFCDTGTVW